MPAIKAQVKSLAAEAEVFRLLNTAGSAQSADDLARAAEVEGR
ncbi:hypothetical protein [Pseudoclavibacter sp. CFCC 13796]|nr:hypothetical protein [Pseudoclavibacter sp. CFCC 13796]